MSTLDETSSVTEEFHCKQPNDRGELLEDEDAERSGRVMQAMLQMEKIDVRGLQQAHENKTVAAR